MDRHGYVANTTGSGVERGTIKLIQHLSTIVHNSLVILL